MTSTTTRLREITVNGSTVATASDTVDALVAEQGFGGVKVATAVNGDFVPERRRADTALAVGDHVEILSVRQGG